MNDFEKLLDDWKSPLVARTHIEVFTQGMYKHQTMAVFDSIGTGITPRYKINKKVFYRAEDVISWMRTRKRRK